MLFQKLLLPLYHNQNITTMRHMKSIGRRLLGKDEIMMFVFGGKGRFVLKNPATSVLFEYRIKSTPKVVRQGYKTIPNPNFDENILFISVKTEYSVKFLGTIRIEENRYIHSKKSIFREDNPAVKGIKWLIQQFGIEDEFPETMEFSHMGACGCCARTLTTEGSVKMGIGPICFERYGNVRLKKLLALKKKMEAKMRKHKIEL